MANPGHHDAGKRITELEAANAQLSEALQKAADIIAVLRHTETQARQVIDSLPAAVALFDNERHCRFTNARWDDWFGTPPPGLEIESTNAIQAALQQRDDADGPEDAGARVVENDVFCRDGALRRLSFQGHPYRNGADEAIGTCLVATDVTDQYTTLAALRDREELFALAMRGPNEGLWDWNPITKELYLSARLLAILGFRGDTVRTTSKEWVRLVHPEDHARYEAAIIAHLKGQTDHFECEYRMADRTGNYRWILARGLARRGRDGQVYRMVGSIGDITDLKHREQQIRASEARFRAIVDMAGNVFLVVDRDGIIREANREAQRLFGGDALEIIGRSWFAVLGEEAGGAFGRQLAAAAAGQPVRHFEHVMDVRDGRAGDSPAHVLLWTINRLDNGGDDGREVLLICAGQDITSRKQAEIALQSANEALESRVAERTRELTDAKELAEVASRAKSEFLANMSHELRTPLNAIIGFADMMAAEMLGPLGHAKYVEYAGVVSQSAHHLLAVINDLLDIAKIEAGRFQIQPVPLDMVEAAEGCLTFLTERAKAGGVRLDTAFAPGLPLVSGDIVRVRQIMLNLLSNAVKFTDAGGRVLLSIVREDDGWVTAQVADTGCGMDPEQLALALEPFGQVDNQMTRRAGGTGLGLPLARRLTEMHGGRFHITSVRGEGTVVSFSLPVFQADGHAAYLAGMMVADG